MQLSMRQSSTKPLPPIPIGGNLLSRCVLETSTSDSHSRKFAITLSGRLSYGLNQPDVSPCISVLLIGQQCFLQIRSQDCQRGYRRGPHSQTRPLPQRRRPDQVEGRAGDAGAAAQEDGLQSDAAGLGRDRQEEDVSRHADPAAQGEILRSPVADDEEPDGVDVKEVTKCPPYLMRRVGKLRGFAIIKRPISCMESCYSDIYWWRAWRPTKSPRQRI